MGTLVCRITLNKNENQGITVYVENGEQITQTIQMNGSNIQVIHKEGSATQKITLDGSSIVAQSTQEGNTSTITQNFGDINISCNSLTVNAKEKISLSGGTSVSIEGETTSITGETKLEAQGGEATLKADTSLSLQGLNTTVKGTNLDLEGEAESNLKSSALVNIQGTLIKIG